MEQRQVTMQCLSFCSPSVLTFVSMSGITVHATTARIPERLLRNSKSGLVSRTRWYNRQRNR
ncbi:hypothetical protein PAL_GLEAN10025751 [Pteropus alecto]|uniref:Uncharacterized protein n=1 Tax=Pteropus alecto TaxID=9402 RepID=L5JYW9_PTEAL|nr:hypothetical protein PAL_GLEAN10025751 [Pteropus alecto]